ncbi:endonuclease III domain-containing protein [Acidobacteria bacterium AH-259-A15]|nr:endonuclease III domain-containing protein [Acidobacteria bacterium AH-259-A15]
MSNSQLIKIYQVLRDTYSFSTGWPDGEWPLSGHFRPQLLEVIVGAILTQNTNWNNVEKALNQMVRQELVEAVKLAHCPQSQLERAIRSAGFYRQKAERLKRVVRFILDYPGDFYGRVRREELLSIKGIGPETADSILLYACDQPHFVVDAYTRRVFARYGLLSERASYQEIKHFFESCLPVDVRLYKRFHALIVEHAKRTCKKTPLCHACVFQTECAYGSKVN